MPSATPRLTRAFFAGPSEDLAERLLGTRLVRVFPDGVRAAGVVVETEAYAGVHDRASHAYNARRTARTEPMFGPPGTCYVYFTYGMHHCVNIVCGEEGDPLAVLIRALEPVEGQARMRALRELDPSRPDHDLCRGPGNVCRALGIDRSFSGIDLATDPRLLLESRASGSPPPAFERTARVGIQNAGEPWVSAPLRFVVASSPAVSGPRRTGRKPGGSAVGLSAVPPPSANA